MLDRCFSVFTSLRRSKAINDLVFLSRLQTSGGKSVITLQKPDTLIDG